MREETRQDVLSAGAVGTKYDEAARMLWGNREILAPLLKFAVTEYQDLPIEEIIRSIDEDSIRPDVPVSDLPARAASLATESRPVEEKSITYDFRFHARNPKLTTEQLRIESKINVR